MIFVLLTSSAVARDVESTPTASVDGVQKRGSILDPLCTNTIERDERWAKESSRVVRSVKNELQQLEDLRRELLSNVLQSKEKLAELQEQQRRASRSLSAINAKLGKVSSTCSPTQTLKSRDASPGAPEDPGGAPGARSPIVILPAVKSVPSVAKQPNSLISSDTERDCCFDSCWDLASCSLLKEVAVFLPQLQIPHLNTSSLMRNISTYFSSKGILASRSEDACLTLYMITTEASQPLQLMDRNHNVVLLDLTSTGGLNMSALSRSIVVASSVFPPGMYRPGYDLVLPPPVYSLHTGEYWKGLIPILPVERKSLLYFQGVWSGEVAHPLTSLLASMKGSLPGADVSTDCESAPTHTTHAEWRLCGDNITRSWGHKSAIFSLSLFSDFPQSSSLVRLVESLRWGSIPVIVGGGKSLPFDDIITWHEIAVLLPSSRLHELHYILASIPPPKLMEMKRRGRFVFETYCRSVAAILNGVMGSLYHHLLHPPPHPPEFTGHLLYSASSGTQYSKTSPTSSAKAFTNSFRESCNLPPGPMFPLAVGLCLPPPVSGSLYQGQSKGDFPRHVLRGGGVTGSEFSRLLLGNRQKESFTVVILTYKRTEVLVRLLDSLSSLLYVDKFLVVWNTPDDPPTEQDWPVLPAPLQVVRGKGNSLNNRFLPFENIRTEGVFCLDDDISITTEEIEMAFRVWRENRERIVGLPGRFHLWDPLNRVWTYNSNHSCEISMVLTGAAFIHKFYMYVYTHWMSEDIRHFVDQHTNCEDIAMNFLVAHITRKPPIKVTTRWSFRCSLCTEHISDISSHMSTRSVCVDHFAAIYGYMPLLYTQWRADSVLFKTKIPLHLEKCYSYV